MKVNIVFYSIEVKSSSMMETCLVWEFCYKNKYFYFHIVCYGYFTFILSSVNLYEAYSESKYRFAVKKIE